MTLDLTIDRFLEMTPKEQATKEKTDKLDFIKIKNFCASKDTIKRVKRQPTERELYAGHISHKVLVSRIHKECLQLNNKKTTQLKMGKGLE